MKKIFHNWTTDTEYELVTQQDNGCTKYAALSLPVCCEAATRRSKSSRCGKRKGGCIGSVFVNGFGVNTYVKETEEEVLKAVEELYPFLIKDGAQ